MIDAQLVAKMVEHWLNTPVNGYFYQSYGQDLKRELLKEINQFTADRFIEKLKIDIPLLQHLPPDQINILKEIRSDDSVYVILEIGQIEIKLTEELDDVTT